MLSISSVGDTGNVLVDSLVWGTKWTTSTGPLHIKVGVITTGGLDPTSSELSAMQRVLAEFQRVINVSFEFVGVDNAGAADLHFKIYNDSSSTQSGWSVPPGEAGVAGFGDINILRNNYLDASGAIASGSADYITYIHEFAHALGLAHPHDNGGGSLQFPGVSEPGHTGFYGLNQGIYTTMSNNDGWQTGPVAQTSSSYGLQSGLMALDILALQSIYGANAGHAAGNTVYNLPAANVVGTAYTAIWDTGGIDTIAVTAKRNATIDLRAATGQFADGAGGFVSSASAINGGFTIAAGVVIENATGHNGSDRITGNAANNLLIGNGGHDTLTGLTGKDTLSGGLGNDRFVFTNISDSGPTMLSADVITDFDVLYDRIDVRGVDAHLGLGGNQAFTWGGFITSFTQASQVRAAYVTGDTVLYLNADTDMSTESVIVLKGLHLLQADDFLL